MPAINLLWLEAGLDSAELTWFLEYPLGILDSDLIPCHQNDGAWSGLNRYQESAKNAYSRVGV